MILPTPTTGEQKAVFDLAWPNGIQEELSQPVAVLINESNETMAFASRCGFRCFTTIDDFRKYVETEILAEQSQLEQLRSERRTQNRVIAVFTDTERPDVPRIRLTRPVNKPRTTATSRRNFFGRTRSAPGYSEHTFPRLAKADEPSQTPPGVTLYQANLRIYHWCYGVSVQIAAGSRTTGCIWWIERPRR